MREADPVVPLMGSSGNCVPVPSVLMTLLYRTQHRDASGATLRRRFKYSRTPAPPPRRWPFQE